MKIQINLDTTDDKDLLALKALVDMLSSGKVLVDRGSGPLKEFDPVKVEVWTSTEHSEMARQHVNLDENVDEVKLNTIAKTTLRGVADCGNSLGLEPVVDPQPDIVIDEDGELVEITKPIVDVTTTKVDVKDANIDEVLDQLDPKPPENKPVDTTAELRKLMLKVVNVHGSEGAKIAGQIVYKISGVRAVAKIPNDKFDEVKKGLLAAIDSKGQGAEPSDSGVTPQRKTTRPTVSPDVDF